MIIKGPGVPAATRVATQVRSVDILPTIAALSGVSAPGMVGAPLLPVHRVEASGNREAYSCCDYAKYGKVFRLLTCLVTKERLKYVRILTKEHKLLREELFDLAADPAEEHDLAAGRADDVKALSARMEAFEKKAYWSGSALKTQGLDEETKRQLESLGYLVQ